MSYVIGIKSSFLKTVGMLVDEDGNIVNVSIEDSSCLWKVGAFSAKGVIVKLVGNLLHLQDYTIPRDSVQCICLGGSGIARPEEVKIIESALSEVGAVSPEKRIITNDAHIALIAGALNVSGIVIISGTGSIIYGRDYLNKSYRVGGWGYILGDEGSAYYIGLESIRHILKSVDGYCEKCKFTDDIIKFINKPYITSATEIPFWVYFDIRFPLVLKDNIAPLAPIITKAAATGEDKIALNIIEDASEHLVNRYLHLLSNMHNDKNRSFPLIYEGGVFSSEFFKECVTQKIKNYNPDISPKMLEYNSVIGSVLLALGKTPKKDGRDFIKAPNLPSDKIIENLLKSYENNNLLREKEDIFFSRYRQLKKFGPIFYRNSKN